MGERSPEPEGQAKRCRPEEYKECTSQSWKSYCRRARLDATRAATHLSPLPTGGSMRETACVRLLIGGVLLAAVSCSGNDDGTGPASATGSLRVIQAAESTATLDVLVDGGVVINGLGAGTISSPVSVSVGQRNITFRPVGGATSPNVLQLAVAADSHYTAVVIDSSTVLNPIALTDSGGVPAAGKSKLQVANFASLAGPIDVYRRQPDFDGLVGTMFPFAYRAVSGYFQSDPGDWQVLVATEARINGVPPEVPQDTLLIVNPISLAAGQAVTVVLLDKAGGGIDAVLEHNR